jgi:protein TonB
VINGTARSLPHPPYPAAARALGVEGAVSVQVTIDESGNVISAKAVNGHPLLRKVSETAAMSARFGPTFLSEVPVKVTGVIVYNFKR